MNVEPQKPVKADYIHMLWIVAAGAALGLVINTIGYTELMSYKGINILKALGL